MDEALDDTWLLQMRKRKKLKKNFFLLPDYLAEWIEKGGVMKPFGSPGGKSQYAADLLERIPPHQTYVEPYAGSATLLWVKPKSKREILSDMHPGIVATLKFLREGTPQDFEWLRKQKFTGDKAHWQSLRKDAEGSPRNDAYKYLYTTLHSRRNRGTEYQGLAHRMPTGKRLLGNLERFHDRLKGVEILQKDALDVIRKHDGPDTFFYVDPPWQDEGRAGKAGLWRNFDRKKFVDVMHTVKGKALISCQGELPIKGYRKQTLHKTIGGIGANSRPMDLYYNYPLPKGKAVKKNYIVVPDRIASALAKMHTPEHERQLIIHNRHTSKARNPHDFVAGKHSGECLTCGMARTVTGKCAGYMAKSVSEHAYPIIKSDTTKGIMYGVVLRGYMIDAHNDYAPPAEIEKAAHRWLDSYRGIDLKHMAVIKSEDASVVESWVESYPTTDDYSAAMQDKPHNIYKRKFGDGYLLSGDWVMGVRLKADALKKAALDGQLNSFSIVGSALRVPITETEVISPTKIIEIG